MVTTLDKFGRILIPKKFRERLGINLKSTLNITEEGKRIILEVIQDKDPLVNRNGILVFTGKLEDNKIDLIKSDRNRRMKELMASKV